MPIRRLTPNDLTACADLSEARGWSRQEHRWALLLAAGTGHGIDAPCGKELAAASVVTTYGSHSPDDASEPRGLAAIGMVLVAERHARQGVGRRLMQYLINGAGNTPLALYATPAGRPLYEQLGFAVTGRVETVQGHFRPHVPPPGPATRPATANDLPAILRLDVEVFGLDRTHMLTRLPAFADQLRIAQDEHGIAGYAAAWPHGQTHVVGPLIAKDTETAKALIASLAAGTDHALRTDIDVRHEELLTWVKKHGLEPVAFNDVMTYKAAPLPGDWTRRFAPLTVATG
ncbi:GNAT family N-acetyltransferase [Streptomyces hypolithicus]